MKAININGGSEYMIGAEHEASRNIAIFGGSGILSAYDKLPVQIINGEIVVGSGVYCNQGYLIEVSEGETVTFAISTLSAGIKRYDLLVSELSRDSLGIETHTIRIISGAPAITPSKPALTRGDFKGGAGLRQEEIAAILINGANATVSSRASLLGTSASPTQKITVTGDASGSVTLGGSGNKTLNLTVQKATNAGQTIYIQSAQPTNPKDRDVWIW